MSGSETIVIGGGVVGAMCAYYLAKAGRRVRVIERAGFGSGCSHGNCGFVCPSHVLPLAAPGAVRKTLAAMLRRNSPFYVKPRFSPTFWRWLWRFARHCNEADMLAAAAARHVILQSSRRLYDALLAEEQIDCEWQERGLLLVYHSQREFEEYAKTDRLLQEKFGVAARPYAGPQLVQLEPALIENLGGGWHYEGDAHLRPDKLMAEMRRILVSLGVSIDEQCEVRAVKREGDQVRALATSNGEVTGDEFVLATGALAPLLARQLGVKLPIQPGKGYSLTMPRPAQCPAIPMLFEEHRVAVTPMESGYRLGSTMELAGYDESINRRRLALLTKAAEIYLHEPHCQPIEEEWWGWRPLSADDKPFIGRAPSFQNFWIAAGHGMLGLTLAPVTGKLIAELVNGETPHAEVEAFGVGRRA